MDIITGHKGTADVTAEYDGSLNMVILGEGDYALGTSNKCAYEIVCNNLIRIIDDDIVM